MSMLFSWQLNVNGLNSNLAFFCEDCEDNCEDNWLGRRCLRFIRLYFENDLQWRVCKMNVYWTYQMGTLQRT